MKPSRITATRRSRKTAFVPRVVFSTVFVGVIPAIASCRHDRLIVLAVAAFSDAPQPAAIDAALAPWARPEASVIVLAVAAFDASVGLKPRPRTRQTPPPRLLIVLAHHAFGHHSLFNEP